ncbi:hypothetical protein [Lysinibacillus sp. NPDC056185]|uniref:hypothetical protein n=1 Tax=Lysinibacillus sp. NPDC056185 TaxID=3345739 RepID=UPI0039F08102
MTFPSVALTSIRHSSGSFRRSDLSFRRSSLSIRRFDFYLSLELLSVTFAPLSSTLTIYHCISIRQYNGSSSIHKKKGASNEL